MAGNLWIFVTLVRKLSARAVRPVLSNLRWYFIYLILFKPKCEVQERNSFWFTLSYAWPSHSSTVTNVPSHSHWCCWQGDS